MTRRQIFMRGLVAGLLAGLGAQAANWLLSAHPDASEARRFAVMLQAGLSVIGMIWLARGIPGEPELSAASTQELPPNIEKPRGLSEGRWQDTGLPAAVSAPSPVPTHRST